MSKSPNNGQIGAVPYHLVSHDSREGWVMLLRAVLCSLVLGCASTPANALTQGELLTKLEAAGYSQIRENGSGKIKTFKAVKNGKEVTVIVDSRGQIKELQ
jgi:hypothetical protein